MACIFILDFVLISQLYPREQFYQSGYVDKMVVDKMIVDKVVVNKVSITRHNGSS